MSSAMELMHPSIAAAAAAAGRLPQPALLAALSELFLLATHAQVLFGIGPDHSYEALKGRRRYFVFDLLSPWAALAAGGGHLVSPAALVLCTLHAALHVFYIATWDSRHTDRVIRLSSTDARRRLQGGRYSAGELAWFFVGTAFDMLTHGALLWLLLTGCCPASAA